MLRTPTLTLALCATVVGCACPAYAQQADPCDLLAQTVDRLYATGDHTDADVVLTIATTAEEARQCYTESSFDPTRPPDHIIPLLDHEVWSLNRLGRSVKADSLVSLFYDHYAGAANDAYRARFALHRLRLQSRQGNLIDAAAAYLEARRLAEALPMAQRVALHLDGASLYQQAGAHDQAARILDEAVLLARSDSTLIPLLGRGLSLRGEATLERGGDAIVRAIEDLKEAVVILHRCAAYEELLPALASLAEAHGRAGNTAVSRRYFSEALALADSLSDPHATVSTLLRRGRIDLLARRLDAAEHDFTEALALSDTAGLDTFRPALRLALADVARRRGDLDEARATLMALVGADLVAEPFEAGAALQDAGVRREARAALLRLYLVDEYAERAPWLWAFVAALLLALMTMVLAFHYHRRLQRLRALQNMDANGGTLFEQRLSHAHLVLRDPAHAAALFSDPHLRHLLTRDRLHNTGDLFACVAALEAEHRGEEPKEPASIARMLRRHFRLRAWSWPATLTAWRHHFDRHPPE